LASDGAGTAVPAVAKAVAKSGKAIHWVKGFAFAMA
jgi:hypothetical protein